MTGWKIVISYYDGSWRPALCELEISEDADIVYREPGTEPIKCRCSKAKVIRLYKCKITPFESTKPDELVPLNGEGFSIYEIANEWNGIVVLRDMLPESSTSRLLQERTSLQASEMASFLFNSNNMHYPTKYAPGNVITPHDFDYSPDEECAPGIHFFRECCEAIRYAVIPDGTVTSYPIRVCNMLNDIKVVPPESNS